MGYVDLARSGQEPSDAPGGGAYTYRFPDEGMIGKNDFDIEALANAGVPAANLPAVQRRVEIRRPGREALNRM